MIYSNSDIHLKATVRFTVIEMEIKWKISNYLCKYRVIAKAANYRKATAVESHFSAVTGLVI